jgi:hypothetical protein
VKVTAHYTRNQKILFKTTSESFTSMLGGWLTPLLLLLQEQQQQQQ